MGMETKVNPCLVKKITNRKEMENRRRLGVQLILEGHTIKQVSELLKVSTRSVDNWISWYKNAGVVGLEALKHPGPKSKLSPEQIQEVCSWLTRDATEFGFRTHLWTSRRIVQVIKDKFDIKYNPNYFCHWLRKQGFSPQMPGKKATQRDEQKIAKWPKTEWSRILKKGIAVGRISYLSMKPD
jgi:putative transposase